MVDTNKLAELSTLAARLNVQTDILNKSIETLNQHFASLNIGLEYWMPRPLVGTGLRQDGTCSPPRKYEENTYLGYGKIGNQWQLALKEEIIDYEWDAENRMDQPITEYGYTALTRASRDLRLLAVEQFDELIDGLKQHVEHTLQSIQHAKELAKISSTQSLADEISEGLLEAMRPIMER